MKCRNDANGVCVSLAFNNAKNEKKNTLAYFTARLMTSRKCVSAPAEWESFRKWARAGWLKPPTLNKQRIQIMFRKKKFGPKKFGSY